jgi:hypothetical protein
MVVSELEEAVWERDRVRIVVRAPGATNVGNWNYANAANGALSVTRYLNVRIAPLLGGLEVTLIDGRGHEAHGATHIDTVRATYQP